MTNLYPLQKTLCFELRRIDKPEKKESTSDKLEKLLDKTLENFENNKILDHAKIKAQNFKIVKDLLNKTHIEIIEESLNKLSLDKKFNKYISQYFSVKDDINNINKTNKINKRNNEKPIRKIKKIRKENQLSQNKNNIFVAIIENFRNHDKYEKIFSDERFEILKEKYPDQKDIISSFESSSSYFTEYDEKLKYLYEADDKDKRYNSYKSIPYILVNYNLPIFVKNSEVVKNIYDRYIKNKQNIIYISKEKGFELSDLLIKHEDIMNSSAFSNYLTKSGIDNYNDIVKKINQEITKYNKKQYKKAEYNRKQVEKGEGKEKFFPYFSYLGTLKDVVDLEQDTYILKKIYDDTELVDILKTFISEEFCQEFNDVFNDIEKKYDLCKLYVKTGKYLTDILGLNENKKINESYIRLSKFKYQNVCEKISNKVAELSNNFYKSLKNNTLQEILNCDREEFLINNDRNLGRSENKDKNIEEINAIKDILESIKEISDFVYGFIPKIDDGLVDFDKINFDIYNKINYERLSKIDLIYNHVKSYFTLKNFSTRQIRLNFDADSFLKSWDLEHIDSNLGTILIKEEDDEKRYFLGIINKDNFSKFEEAKDSKDIYKQMICDVDSSQQVDDESEKAGIVKFKNISADCIDNMVENDELYLFQICNKYLSKKVHTNKNLHTMYLENIFDDYNIKNNIFSINGESKLFYRPKSLEKEVTHIANEPIKNKNKNNPKKESKFEIDLIKDKRYTENKLMVHIPITINNNSQVKEILEFQHYLKNRNILNKKILELQQYLKERSLNQNILNKKILELQKYLKEQSLNQNILNKKLMELQKYLKESPLNQITLSEKILELQKYLQEQFQIILNKKILLLQQHLKNQHINQITLNEKIQELLELLKEQPVNQNILNKKILDIQEYLKKLLQIILNKKIQEKIKNSDDIHIIGISRSRDDLLCTTVIDSNGKKVTKEPISLSKIYSKRFDNISGEAKIFEQDYNALIMKKEKEKIKANKENNSREEWQSEKSIKDFLNGYTSQVVNKIADILKNNHNSIIVFEEVEAKQLKDSKFEGPLYRDLIKALIVKLSYLVDKKEDKGQLGSAFRGYQLAYYDKEDEKEYGKLNRKKIAIDKNGRINKASDENIIQNGIVFHNIPSRFTSDIDIETGFINCFCLKNDISIEDMKEFIGIFEHITLYPEQEIYKIKYKDSYEEEKIKVNNSYAFEFEYEKFKIKKKAKNGKEIPAYKFLFGDIVNKIKNKAFFEESRTIYSCVDRVEEKEGNFVDINLNDEFTVLFKNCGIITEKIREDVISEFKTVVRSHDFKIDDEDIKNILLNLRNNEYFIEEFNAISEKRDYKVLELLKKYHILKNTKIDIIEKENKSELQKKEASNLYHIVDKALKILERYEKRFFEIKDIKSDIIKFLETTNKSKGKDFCKEFVRLFNLMLQIKNYDKENNYEYILSPVTLKGSMKFLSMSYDENSSENVAKKGLILVNKIKNAKDDLDNLELKVTDEEWISSVIGE